MRTNFGRHTIALIILGFTGIFMLGEVFSEASMYTRAAFTMPSSPETFEFKSYDRLLKKYVHDWLVDYRQMRNSTELNEAVNELEHTRPDRLKTNTDKLAFWINAYNLLTYKQICDSYPLTKAAELENSKHGKFIIGGRIHTRKDIRENLIYPLAKSINFKAVFLIPNGSMGGPPVISHPITNASLHNDIEKQMTRICRAPQNTYYNKIDHIWRISQLFKACENICKPAYVSPFAVVNEYLPVEQRVALDQKNFEYRYFDMDDSLNEMPLSDRKFAPAATKPVDVSEPPERKTTPQSVQPAKTPASRAPAARTPVSGTPAAGTPAAGTPTAGTPAAGTPTAGTPAVGTPAVGTPAAGTPAANKQQKEVKR